MSCNNQKRGVFQQELISELEIYLKKQSEKFPEHDTLKADLHCHDFNSNVPDELLARILNVPETWISSEQLLNTLKRNNCDVFTITNHNNARSCWELIDEGKDILVGAEFTSTVPDFNIQIHVLAYGFSKDQEHKLNKLRKDVYRFQKYAKENSIPTIWAHPLYHYNPDSDISMEFFDKMVLIFERFEVLNGQRDTWQNMLVKEWICNITADEIDKLALKYRINLTDYCENPYRKSLSGGSDSHMGIFAGRTGTRLYIKDLAKRKQKEPLSKLALEAIRKGNMAPYGAHQNSEKLTIAFISYLAQIAINRKDPGLMRILLHKGSTRDKLIALMVSNGFSELQRHKVTMSFIELFQNSLQGKSPANIKRMFIPGDYKPIFDDAKNIASTIKRNDNDIAEQLDKSVGDIFNKMNNLFFRRFNKKIRKVILSSSTGISLESLLENFEIPSELRYLLDSDSKGDNSAGEFVKFLDGLSFPFLASGFILASFFTSSKVLYNDRKLLNEFSEKTGKFKHPKRTLWLTDTYDDKNGVSMVLQLMQKKVKERNLPIDILVCSNTIEPDDNLIVVRPESEVELPFYKGQLVRIPNFLEIHRLFADNEYDNIICSTEGVMGLLAIYLKHTYSVKASFFMHTDWIMFVRKVLNLKNNNISRLRRFLRAYYKNFDDIFVLNKDHKRWLSSKAMGFDEKNVHLTAHWAENMFKPVDVSKYKLFGVDADIPVMLFVGRVSKEKGIYDMVSIYRKVKKRVPYLKLVVAGIGPELQTLKEDVPEAKFLGWVDREELPSVYSASDILVLPSQFDTFSCVVLESISCGLPVAAYKTKGPKDILDGHSCGFLSKSSDEMADSITEYFSKDMESEYRKNALKRAADYDADKIVDGLLDVVFSTPHEPTLASTQTFKHSDQ